MMREVYESPNMEVVVFETEDIITTSGISAFSMNETDPITGFIVIGDK